MSLILATGSNLGDKKSHLSQAKAELQKYFHFIAESKIYGSAAIEYLNQPDFYNQVLEFEIPKDKTPSETMSLLLKIEKDLGRNRDIPKGPRTVDIDIIFWGTEKFNLENVDIPHPRWSERSFVVEPLKELPYFEILKKHFIIPKTYNNSAVPVKE